MHIANDMYNYSKSGKDYSVSIITSLAEIRDPFLEAELLQVRFVDINSPHDALTCKDSRDHKGVLGQLLNEHKNIYLQVVPVCRMVSAQDEGETAAPTIDLFYPGSTLIVKSSKA